MKDRLERALKALNMRRATLLNEYLMSLERLEWNQATSMTAYEESGRLRDCDQHITTITLELKRLELAKIAAEANAPVATAAVSMAIPLAEVANAS